MPTISTSPPLVVQTGATQAGFGNSSINTFVGNAGGLTLDGGTATSDSLTLGANTQAFSDTNTGRIVLKERMVFSDNFTVAGASLGDSLFSVTSTITSGATVNIFSGYKYNPIFIATVAQILSSLPAFSASPTIQHTAAVTDVLSYYMGFQSTPKISPNVASGTLDGISAYGYTASPRTAKSGTVGAIITALDGYNTYGTPLIGVTDLADATIATLNHFRAIPPVLGTGIAVTTEHGFYAGVLAVGGTLIAGFRSDVAAGTGKWGFYDSGGANNSFKGNTRLGDNTAPTALLDLAGKLTASSAGLVTKYNNIATVSNGVPSILATVDLAAQTAAKTATTLYTPTATGFFRISVYLQVTTPGTTSVLGGTTGVVLTYNDGDGNVAQSDTMALMSPTGTIVKFLNTNTTATNLNGTSVIYARTGVAIQYAIDYTSAGTAMQYAAHLKLEAL